jgi:hypothetical protein
VANNNTSESDSSSSRSRTGAGAKQASRQPAKITSSSREQSGGNSDPLIDTAADMSEAANADPGNPAYDEIAVAAYHRYLGRGGQDGGDFDDWLEAERELRSRRFR